MVDMKHLTAGITQLGSECRALVERVEALKRRREDLDVLPVSREEFTAMLLSYIDDEADQFIRYLRGHLMGRYLNKPFYTPERGRLGVAILGVDGTFGDTTKVVPGAIYGLFRTQVKEAVSAAVAECDWPEEVGPPREERPREKAKLDEEIAGLEAKLDKLRTAARAAGIRL